MLEVGEGSAKVRKGKCRSARLEPDLFRLASSTKDIHAAPFVRYIDRKQSKAVEYVFKNVRSMYRRFPRLSKPIVMSRCNTSPTTTEAYMRSARRNLEEPLMHWLYHSFDLTQVAGASHVVGPLKSCPPH
jgi:hypothetical protein